MSPQSVLVAALAVTLLFITVALIREARVRRALERLLAKLLTRWRNTHAKTQDSVLSDRDARDRSRDDVARRL